MKAVLSILLLTTFASSTNEMTHRIKLYFNNPSQLQEFMINPTLEVLNVYQGYIDVIIPEVYVDTLQESALRYEVIALDISRSYRLYQDDRGGVFGNYYRYSEIYDAILGLQSQYPTLVKVDSLPTRSIEDRALYTVKISSSPNANNGKPEVLFTGALHAYEPIGPSVCMGDMTHLCEQYTLEPELQWLVDNRQIFFIPVLNPDGYVFNETYPSRMWRKNRRLNYNGSYGVDLNRNYPYKWGYDDIGSSPNPNAWNYRGEAPASEPETQAVIDFVNNHQIRTWHNYHAPGDVLLIPFSYINSYPWDDTLEYYTMCREETMLYGFLDWGNSSQAYGYPCNGELGDWAWCDSSAYQIFGLVPEIGMDYWEGLTDSSIIVDVCQRMLGADIYLSQVAGFYPLCSLLAVTDSFPGSNNDGILNPGEVAALTITLKNKAVVDTALALSGYLSTTDPIIHISDSTGAYGDVVRLATVTNTADPFVVQCDTAANPYDWIEFELRLVWNAPAYEKTIPCSLQIGPASFALEHKMRSTNQLFSLPTVFTGSLNPPESKTWTVFDVSGRQQDISTLKPGIYFVINEGSIIQKVIKVK